MIFSIFCGSSLLKGTEKVTVVLSVPNLSVDNAIFLLLNVTVADFIPLTLIELDRCRVVIVGLKEF